MKLNQPLVLSKDAEGAGGDTAVSAISGLGKRSMYRARQGDETNYDWYWSRFLSVSITAKTLVEIVIVGIREGERSLKPTVASSLACKELGEPAGPGSVTTMRMAGKGYRGD